MYEDEDNDGKFPDESPVKVRYPARSRKNKPSARWRSPCSPCGAHAGTDSHDHASRARGAWRCGPGGSRGLRGIGRGRGSR
jgi:hypothetical protein